MKKCIVIFVLCLLFPLLAGAVKVNIDGISYNIVKKLKQAEVTHLRESTVSIDGLTYVGSGYNLQNVDIPSSVMYEGVECYVTSIGNDAFGNCKTLTSITIPETVTSIGGAAFRGCSGLTSITLPESVTSIGDGAFLGCTDLSSINIPESVTSIGAAAFRNCYSISSVVIPEGVPEIKRGTFEDCKSLVTIAIPKTVTSIGDYVFSGCCSLTSISLPDGIPYINYAMFQGCSSLTSISIPESVTIIANNAFWGCSSLTNVTIPKNVTKIGNCAFEGCERLTSVTLPESLKIIYFGVFRNCEELLDVYCYAEALPETGVKVFENSYVEHATLHVPESSIEKYKSTEPWSDFGKIVALENSVNTSSFTPHVQCKGGVITLSGLPEHIEVSAYDVAGRKIDTATTLYGAVSLKVVNYVGSTVVISIEGQQQGLKLVVK